MHADESNPHKARMQAIMAALERGDRRPFGEALAEDFTWILPGRNAWSGRYEGRDTVRERLFQPLFRQFTGTYTNTATRFIAEGNVVVVECRGHVMTRKGKAYDNTYCYVCRFGDDGLLHELVEYMDTQLVADVLEPPSAA
ncbi:nuclear transport factor 2 family protein [Ramlibacter pallidus]|uniref:Nuclear transport factor 2 family protein n=1 Tax=Ramlibacter pallidus TaxID=2780087 RepID=A0ABR9S6A2_9BURK|nr:nuclear transport factor 2 family protein [Ramlibacter pallidus]MBE7369043.1 nuclear transport factor 2 family protein [Ramlibacter pallidus]